MSNSNLGIFFPQYSLHVLEISRVDYCSSGRTQSSSIAPLHTPPGHPFACSSPPSPLLSLFPSSHPPSAPSPSGLSPFFSLLAGPLSEVRSAPTVLLLTTVYQLSNRVIAYRNPPLFQRRRPTVCSGCFSRRSRARFCFFNIIGVLWA